MAPRAFSLLDLVRRQRLVVTTVLAVALLAGVNWIQDPAKAWRWLFGMLVLPMVLAGITLWYAWIRRSRRLDDDEPTGRRYFHAALKLAALAVGIRQITLFGLLIWVRIGDHGADLEIERRILGLATAAVFVVFGNALPKILTPLSILPLHLAERVSRARRFVGTIWVILGVCLTIGFVAAPLTLAKALERWSSIAGMLTIVGAIVWMNAGPVRGEP
jgi:hypothetical protein